MLTYVICINNFVGSRLTSVNFFNIPFSIQKSRFLLLDPLLNAGVDTKLVAYWRHQYWTALSWESMEFSTFLIFAVWTSSMTYLTFAKGELQNVNHFLSPYSYFSSCYFISHHSLFLFRWFTKVDALSL